MRNRLRALERPALSIIAVCCSSVISTGFSWLYPCKPISWPCSTIIRHSSGNVSSEWPGMKKVVLMLYFWNSFNMRRTPIVPAKSPREISEVESSPP